ncbi:MAG: hypothetical protein HQL37_05590 [Alphaproteobacteria bacterium]|nr:hypothetical protein [Alphaproteobacteria bacterium]
MTNTGKAVTGAATAPMNRGVSLKIRDTLNRVDELISAVARLHNIAAPSRQQPIMIGRGHGGRSPFVSRG